MTYIETIWTRYDVLLSEVDGVDIKNLDFEMHLSIITVPRVTRRYATSGNCISASARNKLN